MTGASNQDRLTSMRVVVVGAGGIGCACLAYLAGAGVGKITICDGDMVEASNLHRQPLHYKPGDNKAWSAAKALQRLNPMIEIERRERHLSRDEETLQLLHSADAVADCTDNVEARYMLNDGCYFAGHTRLYSASALGLEGSLTNYFFQTNSACYRCLYPRPTHEARRRCGDRGVLGPVPGAIGALLALEIIANRADDTVGVFDGFSLTRFKKPPRRSSCELCGEQPTITSFFDAPSLTLATPKLGAFADPPPLATAEQLRDSVASSVGCLIVDVRDRAQFDIKSLPGAVSAPLSSLLADPQHISNLEARLLHDVSAAAMPRPVFVVCRRGIDSRLATSVLRDHLSFSAAFPDCRHVVGGLEAWRDQCEPDFPLL